MLRILFLLAIVSVLFCGCENATETKTDSSTKTSETAPNEKENVKEDTAETAKKSESTEEDKVIIIDVRTKKEWDEGHLDNAVHIPHTEIVEGIKNVTSDKTAKIYMHCKVGGRADIAKKALEAEGFTNIENLGSLEDARKKFEKAN